MLFSDRLEIWNPGHLPPTLTPEKLRHPHPSIPRNPLLADPLFLAHYIEKAGSGTLDMIGLCREAGLPEPDFRQDGGQWVVTLRRPAPQVTPQVTPQVNGQDGTKSALSRHQATAQVTEQDTAQVGEQVSEQVSEQVLSILRVVATTPQTKHELLDAAGLSDAYLNYKRHILPLLEQGILERTIPSKPTSRLQKYRITEKGRALLKGANQ